MTDTWIDWSRLGYPGDPIPGNPDGVQEGAILYRKTATAMDEGADALGLLIGSNNEIVARSIDAVSLQADKARAVMADLHGRFNAMSGALDRYAPVLRESQRKAAAAAQDALQATESYERHKDQYAGHLRQIATLDPDTRAYHVEQANVAAHAAGVATGALAEAKARIEQARQERDEAAGAAQSTISQAIAASTLNDTFSDHLNVFWESAKLSVDIALDGIKKVGKWIWDNLDMIVLVLEIASIVLAFVFPPAAIVVRAVAVLLKVARIAKTVKAVVEIRQDLARGDRKAALIGIAGLASTKLISGLISSKAAPVMRRVFPQLGTANKPNLLSRVIARTSGQAVKPGAAERVVVEVANQHKAFGRTIKLDDRVLASAVRTTDLAWDTGIGRVTDDLRAANRRVLTPQ